MACNYVIGEASKRPLKTAMLFHVLAAHHVQVFARKQHVVKGLWDGVANDFPQYLCWKLQQPHSGTHFKEHFN